MEIDGKSAAAGLNPGVQRLDLHTVQTHRTAKPGESGANPGSDRIELSVRSREIQHVDELISSTPDIREARVEQIRGAVESGTYNVKAEKIADKILGGSVIDQIF